MNRKEWIIYSAAIIVLLAILIVLVEKLHERDAEPKQVIVQIAQEESHPHPHPLRFRSPDELRAWRVYVASALPSRVLWNVSDVISNADRLIRAERERKPIPKPKPRKENAL